MLKSNFFKQNTLHPTLELLSNETNINTSFQSNTVYSPRFTRLRLKEFKEFLGTIADAPNDIGTKLPLINQAIDRFFSRTAVALKETYQETHFFNLFKTVGNHWGGDLFNNLNNFQKMRVQLENALIFGENTSSFDINKMENNELLSALEQKVLTDRIIDTLSFAGYKDYEKFWMNAFELLSHNMNDYAKKMLVEEKDHIESTFSILAYKLQGNEPALEIAKQSMLKIYIEQFLDWDINIFTLEQGVRTDDLVTALSNTINNPNTDILKRALIKKKLDDQLSLNNSQFEEAAYLNTLVNTSSKESTLFKKDEIGHPSNQYIEKNTHSPLSKTDYFPYQEIAMDDIISNMKATMDANVLVV